jgi:hypothetical protein
MSAPRVIVQTKRDALLIYAAGFVRSGTVSLVGVTLAIHLADVGFSTTQIGLLIGVGLAGSSLATASDHRSRESSCSTLHWPVHSSSAAR